MKKISFYFLVMFAGIFAFVSCDKEEDATGKLDKTVGFEGVELGAEGYRNQFVVAGDSLLRLFDFEFYNKYTVTEFFSAWQGFAVSNNTNMLDGVFENQYSVYGTGGANDSQNFAVLYQGDTTAYCKFSEGKEYVINSLMYNNTTYAALAIRNGNQYARPFALGDYFKLIFTGYNAAGDKVGTKEVYLADYRNEGTSFVCDSWTTLSFSDWGRINKIEFTFDSSDKGEFGINTPAYACIDNINYMWEK